MAMTNSSSQPNGMPSTPRPIVIAGGGCVGLFLALLLTQSDIPNRVMEGLTARHTAGLC